MAKFKDGDILSNSGLTDRLVFFTYYANDKAHYYYLEKVNDKWVFSTVYHQCGEWQMSNKGYGKIGEEKISDSDMESLRNILFKFQDFVELANEFNRR